MGEIHKYIITPRGERWEEREADAEEAAASPGKQTFEKPCLRPAEKAL